MTPEVNPSPIGALLAVFFVLSFGGVLSWMLRLPRAPTEAAARVCHSVSAVRHILVPVLGTDYSDRGIELACRIGREQKAEIILSYVIEVPFSLPLGAPLPVQETRGKAILERAKSIVEIHELRCQTRLERSRFAGDKVVEMVRAEDLQMVILGVRPRLWPIENLIGRTSETLLRKLPCEVILDAFPECAKPWQET
ncbi:MAG: universal stress protein [Armatimonadetes bacterium]|nr:universal stress protein [Armatimonadota bacterium]